VDTSTVFLGVIALATLVMATVQLGIIFYGAKLARRVDRLVDVVETEIKPTLGRVNAMSEDVSRATALAAVQAERFDKLGERVTVYVDQLAELTEDTVIEPMRRGAALLRGLKVVMAALRGVQQAGSRGEADVVADSGR
jgi:hypothetical protein